MSNDNRGGLTGVIEVKKPDGTVIRLNLKSNDQSKKEEDVNGNSTTRSNDPQPNR